MIVQIEGLSPRQCQIADLLWVADEEQLQTIFRLYGSEARLVQEMMILAAIDQEPNQDFEMANNVIDFVRRR